VISAPEGARTVVTSLVGTCTVKLPPGKSANRTVAVPDPSTVTRISAASRWPR
jgi:hypothetical protein